ncbi:hypothetical protein Tco_0690249, partial [Tanacetum coccineum]
QEKYGGKNRVLAGFGIGEKSLYKLGCGRERLKIVMENPNSPNESNEAIPEVNPVIPEPNHVGDAHDPNEMVDIPDDESNMNGWLEEDDDMNENVNDEDIEDEDVEMEVDDEAEESSDSVSSDSRVGVTTRLILHLGITGRDLRDYCTRARLIEAEVGTNRTETALLDSKIKIGEKERKILDYDLGNVEKTLGVLHESIGWNKRFYGEMVRKGAVPKPPSDEEDDGHPRKKSRKSDKDDGPSEPRGPPIGLVFLEFITLDGDMSNVCTLHFNLIMPPKPMSEARMREIIRDQVTTSMNEFMANMNHGARCVMVRLVLEHGGAGDVVCRSGGDGAVVLEPVIGCIESMVAPDQWKLKSLGPTLQGRALTWWNGRTASMGIDAANGTPWAEVRKWMTEEFCPRSVLQRLEQELYNLKLNGGLTLMDIKNDSVNWPWFVSRMVVN